MFRRVRSLVGTGRFELPTCRLGGGRSIHLSYVPTHKDCTLRVAFSVCFQAFAPNIVAVVHSFELNLPHCFVGGGDGGRQICPGSRHSQHPSSGGLQPACAIRVPA